MTVLPQRPLRGSRISSFYPVKSLPSLSSLDSAFQLQEYISLLIRLDVHDVDAIVSLPGKSAGKEKEKEKVEEGEKDDGEEKEKEKEADTAEGGEKSTGDDGEEKGKNDVMVDEACWIYEQLRRLAQDLTHPLITMLQQECTRASCPEMKAGEWLYLCVAHGNDGAMEQCCAIDYILHTLDSATALLNTPRAFPSRLQIPQTSHRHFSSLARRLGRIFAHAYFHHREAFEQAEAESSLYARFLALTSKFDLVPPEFLVIPTRAVGLESDDRDHDHERERPRDRDGDREQRRDFEVQPPRLLAAAVDPRAAHDEWSARLHQQQGMAPPSPGVLQGQWDRRGSVVAPAVVERQKSSSPPGLSAGSESPRKVGRNRTDTMVLSEAFFVADELAKADKAEEKEKKQQPLETSLGESATGKTATAGNLPLVMVNVPDTPDDLLSPIEDFPKTAKPRADTPEGPQPIDNSLPESPIIKSPGTTSASTLPSHEEATAPAVDTEDLKEEDSEPAAVVTQPNVDTAPAVTDAPASAPGVTELAPEPAPALALAPNEVEVHGEAGPFEADISEVVVTAVLPMPTISPAEEPAEAAGAPAPEVEVKVDEKAEKEAEAETKLGEAAAAAAAADIVATSNAEAGAGKVETEGKGLKGEEQEASARETADPPPPAPEEEQQPEPEKVEQKKAVEGEGEALGVAAALIGDAVEKAAELVVPPSEETKEEEEKVPAEEPVPSS